jgi:hypothetical protein
MNANGAERDRRGRVVLRAGSCRVSIMRPIREFVQIKRFGPEKNLASLMWPTAAAGFRHASLAALIPGYPTFPCVRKGS